MRVLHLSSPLCFPRKGDFLLQSASGTHGKGTDHLWPIFPTVNELAGTVEHLASELQQTAAEMAHESML